MFSMTGYGEARCDSALGNMVWEIRSLNQRYLEVQIKSPESRWSLEKELTQKVAARIKRGRVECYLHFDGEAGASSVPVIDKTILQNLLSAMHETEKNLPNAAPADLLALLRWPGVMRQPSESPPLLQAEQKHLLLQTFDAALEEMVCSRAREGSALCSILHDQCLRATQHCAALKKHLPAIEKKLRQRLEEKAKAWSADLEPERLMQELFYHLQRSDVAEEIDRLESHLSAFQETLALASPIGKRLDFILQELHRETNTMAAKTKDMACAATILELKLVIEQMREQTQNIE